MKTFKKQAVLLLLLSVLSTAAYAEREQSDQKKRKGPPQEALTACEGLQVEQACTFSSRRHGEISGTCIVPKNDESVLACKPERKARK